MSVKTREQEQTAAEVAAANLANQAGKVRDAVGRWAAPKPKTDTLGAPPDAKPGLCSVLVVAATDDKARQLVNELRDAPAEFTHVGTHGSLIGRGFDLIVYRPGWRGVKTTATNPHPAADTWKEAICLTRFRDPRQKWELYL